MWDKLSVGDCLQNSSWKKGVDEDAEMSTGDTFDTAIAVPRCLFIFNLANYLRGWKSGNTQQKQKVNSVMHTKKHCDDEITWVNKMCRCSVVRGLEKKIYLCAQTDK